MTTQINLEGLLDVKRTAAKREFEDRLRVIHDGLQRRLQPADSQAPEKARLATAIATEFSTIYLASSAELAKIIIRNQEMVNLASSAIAAQGVVQGCGKKASKKIIDQSMPGRSYPDYNGFAFNNSPKYVIDTYLTKFQDFIISGRSSSDICAEAQFFFSGLAQTLTDLVHHGPYQKYRTFLQGLVVTGPQFRFEGFKPPKVSQSQEESAANEELSRGFEILNIGPDNYVERKDIVGNELAVHKLRHAVYKLMAFNANEKVNPFKEGRCTYGFSQGFLLSGQTGTGKTLTAFYGISLADQLARKWKKPFLPVKFDICTSYQEGGYQMLKHQLDSLSAGEKIYLVFIDEIDGLFTNRDEPDSNLYQRQKLNLLLSFLSGGYANRGNYVMVATTNKPSLVDTALSDARLDHIVCEGPLTAEQKSQVLQLHLSDGIRAGIVTVSDWKSLGEQAYQLQLNGRRLQKAASVCLGVSTEFTPEQYEKVGTDTSGESAKKSIIRFRGKVDEAALRNALGYVSGLREEDC